MGRRYFIPNGTSSMPVFQFLWEMAWAVPLLFEMLGVAPGPAAQSWALLMGAAGQPCLLGLWWDPGYKAPKGPCEPEGSFWSCICKSELFCWLGLQSLWAIWESQRTNYCLDVCIFGDSECGAGDHMLLSAGAVPNLGVVKRHLPAGVIHHPVHSKLEQRACD